MAATNINRVVLTGNLTRDPELRSTRAACPCARCASPATRAARRDAASGRTSRTTSTSRSGAPRARTARASWPRAARWRSTAASSGASGRTRTTTSAQAVEIIADSVQFLGGRDDAAAAAATASRRAPTSRPTRATSSPPARPAGGGGAAAPATTTSRSRGQAAPAAPPARGRRPLPLPCPAVAAPVPRGAHPSSQGSQERFSNVAKQRSRPTRRRDRKGGPGGGRRKSCQYCRDKVEFVDYKDITTLRKFISDRGQDPLAPDHRGVPAASEPDRHGRQARARAGAAAVRRRHPRVPGRPR